MLKWSLAQTRERIEHWRRSRDDTARFSLLTARKNGVSSASFLRSEVPEHIAGSSAPEGRVAAVRNRFPSSALRSAVRRAPGSSIVALDLVLQEGKPSIMSYARPGTIDVYNNDDVILNSYDKAFTLRATR